MGAHPLVVVRWAPHRSVKHQIVDEDPLHKINVLVEEEKSIREHETRDHVNRLNHFEETLDQCWDLLRQRRARHEFGRDPSEAAVRDDNTVEKYLQ